MAFHSFLLFKPAEVVVVVAENVIIPGWIACVFGDYAWKLNYIGLGFLKYKYYIYRCPFIQNIVY